MMLADCPGPERVPESRHCYGQQASEPAAQTKPKVGIGFEGFFGKGKAIWGVLKVTKQTTNNPGTDWETYFEARTLYFIVK